MVGNHVFWGATVQVIDSIGGEVGSFGYVWNQVRVLPGFISIGQVSRPPTSLSRGAYAILASQRGNLTKNALTTELPSP